MAEFNSPLTMGRPVRWQSLYAHYFFVAMALVFILMAVVGFGQDYKLIYAQHVTIFWFAHVHGAFLTAWLLVFQAQTLLAAKGNLKFHRQLGLFSVVLGVLVWISMGVVIFHANIGYPMHARISWANVLFLTLLMNLFGLFFTWGVLVRKKAAAHKRLLFLATLILIEAGFNRVLLYAGINPTLRWLPFQSISGMPNPSALFLYNDLLLILLFIYDFVTVRRIHKMTLTGSVIIISAHITIIILWRFLS